MQRRKQALELLNTLAPFGDPAVGLINMQAVIMHALRFGFDMANPEQFLGQGPDPMQMLMQQMQGGAGQPALGMGGGMEGLGASDTGYTDSSQQLAAEMGG